MPPSHHLQISRSSAGDAALSPEQKRFNTLIGQIGQARATLAAWQAQIPLYHQAHVKRIEPLIRQCQQVRRETVFVLDGLSDHPVWTRAEFETLREVILDRLGDLLASEAEPDPQLKALVDKHADPKASRAASRGPRKAPATADDIDSAAEPMTRFEAELAAERAAQEKREAAKAASRAARGGAKAGGKKTGTAQSNRDAETQQATQSVRAVYRQLASALHPDREPDVTQRDVKTALMQRVNTAYAANDLLALLELQLATLQVDASHLQGASAQRLTHYNRVLAAQLRELTLETERVQLQFELDFGIDAPGMLNPMKLGRLVDEGYRDISAALAAIKHEAHTLTDHVATREWLKRMRRALRDAAADDDLS